MTTFDDPDQTATRPGTPDWWIYRGTGVPIEYDMMELLPPPPPWRNFSGGPILPVPYADDADAVRRLGHPAPRALPQSHIAELEMVNAAIYLRRPLLVTGRPGTGKSSLAYRIARELRLGRVLRWPITTASALGGGLYDYDAIGRVQAASSRQAGLSDASVIDTGIGNYIQLGPLGTALLPYARPRVLLIDEIDKSDINLPNDLLSVLDEGSFAIRELSRLASVQPDVTVFTSDPDMTVTLHRGRVECNAFPVIVITSNGEREFPPAFLRRCLRLEMPAPDATQLAEMVAAHFPTTDDNLAGGLIREFVHRANTANGLPADHLLNALYLATSGAHDNDESWPRLVNALWQRLSTGLD